MLPEINGYELLEYIKPIGTPVIFLTAKSGVDDRIKGLKLGADDYISKPFQVGELMARVQALLRRCGKSNNKLSFADVEIDTVSRTIKKAGIPIDLTVKEFDLLVVLIENKNVALYRERLYEKVWGETYLGDTRTLDSHIQRLRRKLGWDNYIKTVFRVGYRLEDRE
jgi:DNA-binding response OmpR family regulator